MIPVSNEYRRQLISGNRKYVIKLNVNLADETSIVLTNEHIWDNGIILDNAISSDDSFDLGCAIVGSLKVIIDNIKGNFSTYDFYNAKLTLYMGVTGDVDENDVQRYYRIGFYTVDRPSYNGSLITLYCLDNMTWFDVPFDEVTGITYPTTAGQLVNKICLHVGVLLGTPHFPNYTFEIAGAPEQKLNCREVIQYIAQMCCCYCKIDRAGELALSWYDKQAIIGITNYDGGTYHTTTTPYSDGDDVDGGHFVPWDGDNADGGLFSDLLNGAYLSQNYEINVSTDDIVVTGCRVRNSTSSNDEKAYDELWVDSLIEQDHERYVLVIENNPFITKTNAASIANIVGNILAGLPIRGFSATSLNDISYETGDMVTIIDFRGNRYYTWITHFTFTTNNSESFNCGVQSIKKRNEERFSSAVKTLAEAKQNAEDILTDYDRAVKAMNELAQNAIGYSEYYYPSEATALTSRVTYRFNGADNPSGANPKFPNSTVVFKISGDGVFVSTSKDSQGYEVFTNGYDANSGTAILNLLYAQGLNAKWIKAGTIDTARLNVSGIVNGINNGTTTINGGKITTNTITASQIKAGAVGADQIAANAITAGKIQAGAVDTNKLAANAVTAAKLNVTSLDAITATMGNLNIDKNITISSNGSLGARGSAGSMNGAHIANGDFGIATDRGGSWSVLCYGQETADRTGWSKACCVLWNGGDASAGFHVCNGAPNDHRTFTAMKDNIFQVYVENDLKAWFNETGAHTDSDKRRKKNIKSISTKNIRDFLKKINPVNYIYKKDKSGLIHYGLIAQDVKQALDDSGLYSESVVQICPDADDTLFINYQEFHGIELSAIKDLYEIIQLQQEKIDLLQQEVGLLKEKVGE